MPKKNPKCSKMFQENPGEREDGNTNSLSPPDIKINPAVHWCFTLFDYNEEDIFDFINCSKCSIYTFQEESCPTTKKLHLQGYMKFKNKLRPGTLFTNKTIHWEVCRNIPSSQKYCYKKETSAGRVFANIPLYEKIEIIKELRPFQKKIYDLVLAKPDERVINWFWEPKGNTGKSALAKYLSVKLNAMTTSGKTADMFNSVLMFKKKHGLAPRIILIDVPRSNFDYINYSAIEKIKDGHFYSGKYEGGELIMNSPHIIVFANEKPDTSSMSKDRWNVVKL